MMLTARNAVAIYSPRTLNDCCTCSAKADTGRDRESAWSLRIGLSGGFVAPAGAWRL